MSLARFATRLFLAALLGLCPGCHRQAASVAPTPLVGDIDLRRTDQAVFDSVLPPQCVQADSAQRQMRARLRSGSWEIQSSDPGFAVSLRELRQILQRHGYRDTCSPAVLCDLQCSADADERRVVQGLRTRYLSLIYASPLGWTIAGVAEDATVATNAAALAEALARRLPPSRVHYDAGRRTISDSGGQIDDLIIGSGPAGSVLAHELRRSGQRVVLVERGPFIVPGTMDGREMPWLYEGGGRRASVDGGIWFANGSAVGGGTTVNADLAFAPTLAMVRYRIEQWRSTGHIRPDQFSPQRVAEAYDWVCKTIGTRSLSEKDINANNMVLWNGAIAEGLHPGLYDVNTWPPGGGPSQVTDKRSAVDGLLIDAMCDAKNPLSLISQATAQRIIFDGKRAVGVEIQMQGPVDKPGVLADPCRLHIPAGTTVRIAAKRIIVCAGSLGTATLLLNSHLKMAALGTGLVVHPSMPLIGVFDHPINGLEGTPSSVYVGDNAIDRGFVLEAMSAPPAYVAAMIPGDGREVFSVVHDYRNLAGFGVMLIDTPDPRNRITVDAQGSPQVDYRLSDADKARFRYALAQAARIMFKGGAKQVILPSNEDILGDHGGATRGVVLENIGQADLIEKNLQFIPGRTIVTSAHMQASAKMGMNPADSVVSPDFSVWGRRNLYVMDSSIFPTSVGANPMQSVYTLAKIFADTLLAAGPSR